MPVYVSGSNINQNIVPIALVGGGILAYVYRDKWYPQFLKIIRDISGGFFGDVIKLPGDTGSGSGGGTTPGGDVTGQWYKANGAIQDLPHVRVSDGGCGAGSGSNSGGNRWENNTKGAMQVGFEVMGYVQVKSGAMGGKCSGGHVGLKHGGPNHTPPCDFETTGTCDSGVKSCCCWWDSGIDNDQGKSYMEIEHSHNNNCKRKYFASTGKIDIGKPIGVRWLIMREGAGIRLMFWTDFSGTAGANQWKEMYNILDTGEFMPTSYYSKIADTQNIEIRVSDADSKDISWPVAPKSRLITSASARAYAYRSYNTFDIHARRAELVPMITVS